MAKNSVGLVLLWDWRHARVQNSIQVLRNRVIILLIDFLVLRDDPESATDVAYSLHARLLNEALEFFLRSHIKSLFEDLSVK